MGRYWIDADTLIRAKNEAYPFGTPVGDPFWSWLAGLVEAGIVVAPEKVYKELVEGRKTADQLAQWVKTRKQMGLCIKPDKAVDGHATAIADYVFTNPQYPPHQQVEFAKGGDAWLIAHALHDGGTVVSMESDRFPNSQRVRIPDVCHKFDVLCITLFDLIKKLKNGNDK